MNARLDLRSAQGLMALQHLPRIGRATALRAALSGNIPGVPTAGSPKDSSLVEAYEWADRELDRSHRAGVHVVNFFDQRYPPHLSEIGDPPVVLFVRGNVDLLSNPRFVAVVGTREPSHFGETATRSITSELAERGWGIVSGLARGIDTIAHRTALNMGASTIAVLGCGLDRIYPRENEGLAGDIVASGGALISELPLGAPPIPRNLIARDRLQSGTAVAVVLAQTGVEGGAMHTARFAAEQGRPIFCPIPPNENGKNEGLRVLLEQPAQMLCNMVPAWRHSGALCKRLGSRPLAHAVTRESIGDLFDRLETALDRPAAVEQQTLLVPDQLG
jgi:DNA processing protein